jgi:HEAT repeat protein
MTISTRFAGLWFLLLLLLGTPALGGGDEAEMLKLFKAQMKVVDAPDRAVLIRNLTETGVPGAAAAISRYMADRDPVVRVAAIRAEGTLHDPRMLGKLLAFTKAYEEDPVTLATVLRAVGEFRNPKALKMLKSMSRKWLPKNSEIASAAAEALGQIPDRSAVELLIGMLERTDPRLPTSSTKDISTETRRTLRQSRPAIVAALKNLTCWDFGDAAAWQRFWKSERRSWKHLPCDRDLSELKTWRDPGYGFSLQRPGEGWTLRSSGARSDYRVYFERRGAGGIEGAVWVYAYHERNGLSSTQKVDERLDLHLGRMKDIRADSVTRTNAKVAGRPGQRLAFTGLDAGGSAVHVDERILLHGGMMFIVGSWRRTDMSDRTEEELKKALAGFTVFD